MHQIHYNCKRILFFSAKNKLIINIVINYMNQNTNNKLKK